LIADFDEENSKITFKVKDVVTPQEEKSKA